MPLSEDHQVPTGKTPTAPGVAPVADRTSPAAACAVADGRERRLDPNSIRAERLSGAIFATVVSLGTLFAVAVSAIVGSLALSGVLLLFAGWLAVSLLLAVLALGWPVLSYRYTAYEVNDQGMRIRRGVLWRTVSSVPRSRVQHTDVSQGPIERMFDLATLVIYTAGTHHASVSLGGLGRDTAFSIRDHLIAGSEDDAV